MPDPAHLLSVHAIEVNIAAPTIQGKDDAVPTMLQCGFKHCFQQGTSRRFTGWADGFLPGSTHPSPLAMAALAFAGIRHMLIYGLISKTENEKREGSSPFTK